MRIVEPRKPNVEATDELSRLLGGGAVGRVVVCHGAAELAPPDLLRSLRIEGALVIAVRCRPGAAPLEPIRDLLRELARGGVTAADQLLRGALWTGGPKGADLEYQRRIRYRRLNHIESIRRCLVEVAEQRPLVVAIENLHHGDQDTRSIVDYFVDEHALRDGALSLTSRAAAQPNFILTLADDDPTGHRLLEDLRGRPQVTVLENRPLDASALALRVNSPELSTKLHELTGGCPRALDNLFALLPDRLEQLAEWRLADVGAVGLDVLRVATLLQDDALSGRHRRAVLTALSSADTLAVGRLVQRGFLVDAGDEIRVADAIAETVISGMSPEERSALHGRIAEYFCVRAKANGPHVHELALHHHLEAGDAEHAAAHVLAVTSWLTSRGLVGRATELLETVCDQLPVVLRKFKLELSALYAAGARYGDALALLDGLRDEPEEWLQYARLHALDGQTARAAELFQELVDQGAGQRGALLWELAEARLLGGDVVAAQDACDQALRCEGLDGGLRARLYNTSGKLAFWRGDWSESRRWYERVFSEVGDDERMSARVLDNLALVDLREGKYEDAARRSRRALATLDRLGEHFDAALCRHNLGIAYEYLQRYELAIDVFEAALEVFERFGHRANLISTLNALGDTYLTFGETWRARRFFEQSRTLSEELGNTFYAAYNRLKLAEVDLLDGRPAQALPLAQAAHSSFSAQQQRRELGQAALVVIKAAREAGESVDLQSLMADAVGSADAEVAARAELMRALIATDSYAGHGLALNACSRLRALGQRGAVVETLRVAAAHAQSCGQSREARRLVAHAKAVWLEFRERIPEQHREAFDRRPEARFDSILSAEVRTKRPVQESPATSRKFFHGLIGEHPEMQRVFDMVERLADVDAPILITGESGTGKELVADAIYRQSQRSGRPFVRVNAAAFAESLLASELFGHEKGAFTGAVSRKLGAFEQADGGTLFLDEIGDISAKTQVALLRVLQEREIRRVGGRRPIKVDVRIICATNRNLEEMVERHEFRLDLYYRIKGLTLALPPLRDRGEDIMAIAEHMLDKLAERHGDRLMLADDAVTLFRRYEWPGNVRELENVLRSVYFFARNGVITAEDLKTYTVLREATHQKGLEISPESGVLEAGFDLNEAKREFELQYIRRALDQTGGNITRAAALLGMKRPRLSQKVKEFNLK